MMEKIDDIDRRIIRATQAGLPVVTKPYDAIAEQTGLPADQVKRRLAAMLRKGVIRRIGVVPNHYRLGMTANGMSVWDVIDDDISRYGALVGGLDFVSHCYHRPRSLPEWPYNLFAMVHGKSRDEVEYKVTIIEGLLGNVCSAHEVLYSKRILKKTGMRLKA